jgi:hypothetical protein
MKMGKGDLVDGEIRRLTHDELRELLSLREREIAPVQEPKIHEEMASEERKLTLEERQQAEPIGTFLMNLTKAVLRSGYYDPDHPGSGSAKHGLFDEFVSVLGGRSEIMFSLQKTRKSSDMMITGIFEEPVSVRQLVGPGVAELFVPKLSEYYERKELLSFTLKKGIPSEHFEKFVDIMSDPKVDRGGSVEAGGYLTNALVEHGITEISTVFVDDTVHLEVDRPWRVEMAIHRLAKDLKVLPMFEALGADAERTMKLHIVQDIIRPLNQPRYLNDFVVNCYIIAKHVDGMEAESIERIVVDSFPTRFLIPTSQYTFEEMARLDERNAKQPDSEVISRRLLAIKRILKLIAARVVSEEPPDAHRLLENLYRNKVLEFETLPEQVQYIINTHRMADAIRQYHDSYVDGFLQAKSPDEAKVYLMSSRRAAPIFVEQKDWGVLTRVSEALRESTALEMMSPEDLTDDMALNAEEEGHPDRSQASPDSPGNEPLMRYVFANVMDTLVSAYGSTDEPGRELLEELIDSLGPLGVEILCGVLEDSENREVRKLSFESLAKKGDLARRWTIQVLDDAERAWFIHRNAMMILREVGRNQKDFDHVRRFLIHTDPRLRAEALTLVVSLGPQDGASLLVNAATDVDAKVRWRALKAIGEIPSVSEETIDDILDVIQSPVSDNKDAASEQMKKIAQLIRALNGIREIPNTVKVEAVILETAKRATNKGKGLMRILKRTSTVGDGSDVLKAAIPLLGRVGTELSEVYLKKLMRSHSEHSEPVQTALSLIRGR